MSEHAIPDDLKRRYEYATQLIANMEKPDGHESIWHRYKQEISDIERIARVEAENDRLERELEKWQEQEAAICPENVGFEEVIKVLRAALARMQGPVMDAEWDKADTLEIGEVITHRERIMGRGGINALLAARAAGE